MGSGAWIDPANPTGYLATAPHGTVVHLRLLRRDERELVARFFAGLSAESRCRRFLQPMPRLSEAMLGRLVDVDAAAMSPWWPPSTANAPASPAGSRWPTSRAPPRSGSP